MAISVAKGLEPETGKRMTEVYGEELAGVPIVTVGGPCLATELAEGLPDGKRVGRTPRWNWPRRPVDRSTDRPTSSPTPTT